MTKRKVECKHGYFYRIVEGRLDCGLLGCKKTFYTYRCPGTHVQFRNGEWLVATTWEDGLCYEKCPARHWYDHADGRLYRLADKPSQALADAEAGAM